MTRDDAIDLANAPDEYDGELTTDEMLAATAAGNSGPDGWDSPGMEVYDGPQFAPPTDQQ